MTTRYPQPGNEEDFEEFCLRFLRLYWNRPTLERYGRRGQGQHGVDIYDPAGESPKRVVQCKHHALGSSIPRGELKAEIKKAETFQLGIDEYYFLTSARRDAKTQTEYGLISEDHRQRGLFKVYLWTWEEIERILDANPVLQHALPEPGIVGAAKIAATVARDVLESPRTERWPDAANLALWTPQNLAIQIERELDFRVELVVRMESRLVVWLELPEEPMRTLKRQALRVACICANYPGVTTIEVGHSKTSLLPGSRGGGIGLGRFLFRAADAKDVSTTKVASAAWPRARWIAPEDPDLENMPGTPPLSYPLNKLDNSP